MLDSSYSIYPDRVEQITVWHAHAFTPCAVSEDARHRLEKVLDMVGADGVDQQPADEPGLSMAQETLEELVRSVARFLAGKA